MRTPEGRTGHRPARSPTRLLPSRPHTRSSPPPGVRPGSPPLHRGRRPRRGRARARPRRLGAREVAPAPGVLRVLPLARDAGSRRRRGARQPGHPHPGPAALAARARGPGARRDREAAARDRGGGLGARATRVLLRRARQLRGDHRRLAGLPAARRDHRHGRHAGDRRCVGGRRRGCAGVHSGSRGERASRPSPPSGTATRSRTRPRSTPWGSAPGSAPFTKAAPSSRTSTP